MLFVMQQNKVVGGTSGHFIRFEKGVPTYVPKEMWSEVQSNGAIPQGELPTEEVVAVEVPIDATDREAFYFKAFDTLIERNERGDFTASGLPNSKILERILNFTVVNKERDLMWEKYNDAKRGD